MFRSIRHGWLLVAGACVLTFVASAFAIIQALLPLEAILGDSEFVLTTRVEKIDADQALVVLTVQEDLKGKAPFRRLAVSFKGDAEAKKLDHVSQLLKRLAPDLPVMLFLMEQRGKARVVFAYTNGTWFQVLGQQTGAPDQVAWSLTHGEPFLRRTFKGTTAEMRQLVIDGLAGKGKLPAVNKKEEPGFGPEIGAKDKTGRRGSPLDLMLSLGSAGSGGPLFGVIPTLGVGAPLVVLAALFPAVFGGVLLLFRQWIAFITVFSVNSMLMMLQWLLNSYWPNVLRDSWLGTEAGLWCLMTLAALAGTIWAWQRQLTRQVQPDLAPDAPPKTELLVLWTLTGVFLLASVLTPLWSWLMTPHYDARTDLATMSMAVLTLGVLTGAIYRAGREVAATAAPLATEGVMIAAILVGQVAYTAYRWGGEDIGTATEPVARVTSAAPAVAGLNAPKFEQIRWQFSPKNFSGVILAAPVVHGDSVWVGAARITSRWGTLFCLDRSDGSKQGEFIGKDGDLKQMISTPVIADSRLYIGEGFHDDALCRLFCVNIKDRSEIWAFPTGSQTEASPCVAGDKVYFAAGNDGIYCVDAASGKQVWRYPPEHYKGRLLRCGSTPAIAGNRLYAGSAVDRNQKDDPGETAIFCLDVEKGSLLWKKAVPLPSWAGPVVSEGHAYYALGNGDVLSDAEHEKPAGVMLSVDTVNGNEIWRYDVPNGIIDKPAIDAHSVTFGCRDGYVYCLGRHDGKPRWKTFLDAPVVAAPALARCPGYAQTAHVFAVSTAGKVACLDPTTGDVLWTLALTDKDAHFSATPSVVVTRTGGGDRRQLYIAGSIGGIPGRPVVFCLEDFVKVE
jgi:outer membrane protein assembly factor BamB